MVNADYHDPNRSETAPMNAESFYTHLYQGQEDDYEDDSTSIFDEDPQYLNQEGDQNLDPGDLFGKEEASPVEDDQDDQEDQEDQNDRSGQGDIASEESDNS